MQCQVPEIRHASEILRVRRRKGRKAFITPTCAVVLVGLPVTTVMVDTKDASTVAAHDTSSDLVPKKNALASKSEEGNTPSAVRRTNWWRKIVGYVWDTVEGDREYRRYVTRLDRIFFPTVLLGYFIK